MKKTISIILVLCTLLTLSACKSSNAKKFSIENTFNYLGEPITSFPFYGADSTDNAKIVLCNKEYYEENGLYAGYYLSIIFTEDSKESGFLGVNDYNVDSIWAEFEYNNEYDQTDENTKITSINFGYKDTVDEDEINRHLCKYFENNSDDFSRTENKHFDYEYTYKYNEDKQVKFGDSISIWEYYICFSN